MSKPIKNLLTQDYKERFVDQDGVVVINFRGIGAENTVAMRAALAEKGVKVTVVKNTLASRALQDTSLAPVKELLDGACAFAYSTDPEQSSVVNVARHLMDQKKEMAFIEVRGAVMEGSLFLDEEQVKALSKYPTREEAISNILGALLGPAATLSKTLGDQGGQLAKAVATPGSQLIGALKAIEDKGGELKKSA